MVIKLLKSNIVLNAQRHNPSEVSYEWIKSILDKKPLTSINIPQMTLYDYEDLVLIVNDQSLIAEIKPVPDDKDTNTERMETVKKIVEEYIKEFKHVPFKNIGLNYIWSVEFTKEEPIPDLKPSLNIMFEALFGTDKDKISFGSIIKVKDDKMGYLLTLKIEPQTQNVMVFNFNYHYDISDILESEKIKKLKEIISRYAEEFYEGSKTIVNSISNKEGK